MTSDAKFEGPNPLLLLSLSEKLQKNVFQITLLFASKAYLQIEH
jgi:hypothetical protein